MKNLLFLSIFILSISCEENHENITRVEPIEDTSHKEVLLVGTLHYDNPGADVAKTESFDILSEKSQHELIDISTIIGQYRPTKIFVEWPFDEQKELDSLYHLYIKNQYFTNDSLSDFYLKNEIFQLAFKVAKVSNLDKVYAIDYSTSFPFDDVMIDIENNNQTELKTKVLEGVANITAKIDNKIESGISLKELTYYINSPEFRSLSNNWHNNLMLQAGALDDFSGPQLTSEWFKRNLYMWSLIQKKTKESDKRIMVLVGGSHAAMLELFIEKDQNWKIKELKDLMEP